MFTIAHLMSECEHGEDESGKGGEEDATKGAEGNAPGVVHRGALVPLAARPVAAWAGKKLHS